MTNPNDQIISASNAIHDREEGDSVFGSAGPTRVPSPLHDPEKASLDDPVPGPKKSKSEISLQDQTTRLSTSKLVIIFCGLGLSLFLSFLDSTSVATASATIANDLHAGETIAWVGTSYLVANTSCQLIYGRLSDIFGRKNLLLGALTIFAIGDLLCGFAQTQVQLYIFRAIAGIGGGGINNMAMIIMSDVTSLRERAKWQGFIASAVAAGSAAGPFLGAVFSQKVTWRWTFWFTPPLTALCIFIVWTCIPLKRVPGDFKAKLAKVDFLGSALSLAANVLVLVPISSGGATWSWSSPLVISMLTVGCLLWLAFIVVEWKIAALPVLPLRLFRYRTVGVIFVQTIFVGMVYYGNLYFLPIFFQSMLDMSAITSACYLLALLVVQTISSVTNGQITMRTGRIKPQIVTGFAFWLIGAGLETLFPRIARGYGDGGVIWWIHRSYIVGFLFIQGIGVGGTLQTTLVSAQAAAPPIDRAVVTGTRNFCRTLGGAFGLALSNAIRNNVVKAHLPQQLPDALKRQLIHSASLTLPQDLDPTIREGVIRAFAKALHIIFLVYLAIVAICFLFSWLIVDNGLPDNAKLTAANKAAATKGPLADDPACQNIPGADFKPTRASQSV
ncbi:MFS general substrate transporter [Punctularia strigosozonata HHB-11173 SS5]|uniref:MFS general substrate transporter n=1 Tax=Punctularia strigosozonata (strain HHB-11173) TaxID=741275 RepID=R7S2L4_PUNST|nr:MFS general substrate transporter [Punctularia strigosozonata HHB-11173 SS5]EIN04453.1 MFS general substrate transporter [Punctularia strigosozonata HHB-11173 SS5]